MGRISLLVRIGGGIMIMSAYDYLRQKRDAILSASGVFWLPSGFSLADVLAAYQFKGVASEDDAKMDLSGNGRNLTKHTQSGNTPEWSASYGWKFVAAYQGASGYLDNSALDSLTIKSAVIRFSNVTQDYDRTYLITAGGSTGYAQIMARSAIVTDDGIKTYGGCGYAAGNNKWETFSTYESEGVVGANFGTEDAMYWNGSLRNTTLRTGRTEIGDGGHIGRTFGNSHAAVSDLNNAYHGGKRIQCAVFFGKALSADQHLEVAQRMMGI